MILGDNGRGRLVFCTLDSIHKKTAGLQFKKMSSELPFKAIITG